MKDSCFITIVQIEIREAVPSDWVEMKKQLQFAEIH